MAENRRDRLIDGYYNGEEADKLQEMFKEADDYVDFIIGALGPAPDNPIGTLPKAPGLVREVAYSLLARGMSVSNVAKSVGVHRTTIYRWALKPEAQDTIQEYQRDLRDRLQDAAHLAINSLVEQMQSAYSTPETIGRAARIVLASYHRSELLSLQRQHEPMREPLLSIDADTVARQREGANLLTTDGGAVEKTI